MVVHDWIACIQYNICSILQHNSCLYINSSTHQCRQYQCTRTVFRFRTPDYGIVRFGKIDGALQTEFAHLACYLVGAILSWRLPTFLIALLQKLEHL